MCHDFPFRFFPGNDNSLPAIEAQLWQIRTKLRQNSLTAIIEKTGTAIATATKAIATSGPTKCKRPSGWN